MVSLIWILLYSHVTFAKESVAECFANSATVSEILIPFEKNYSAKEWAVNSRALCADLKNRSLFNKEPSDLWIDNEGFQTLQVLVDSQAANTKKAFAERLEKIQASKDSQQRIQLAYQLATEAFGSFSFKNMKKDPAILWQLKEKGFYGLNALRAALLAYTIDKVVSKAGYQVHLISASVRQDPSENKILHTWVRIKMSQATKKLTFDLDPVQSGLSFVPLTERKSGVSEAALVSTQADCQALNLCLLKKSLKEKDSS